MGYDIATLVLKEAAILNENVRVVNLPKEGEKCPPGKVLIVSGWGEDGSGVSLPGAKVLRHRYLWAVKQECVDVEMCTIYHGNDKNAVLCVTDKEQSSNSACHGDSGGKGISVNIRMFN